MRMILELPPREEQLAFNRRRWEEVVRGKRQLYLEAGALEFRTCDLENHMTFHLAADPERARPASALCPEFPTEVSSAPERGLPSPCPTPPPTSPS